jgi:hypothetical protein
MTEQFARAAFHESGHAAACIVLGLRVSSVTIERTVTTDRNGWEAFAGVTQVDLGDPLCTAIVCLAGPAASRRLSAGDTQTGMEGDYRRADKAIDAATGECNSFPNLSVYGCRRANIALQVRASAEQIAEHHWPEIVAIANALLECKTIGGDAAVQLFERSLHSRGGRVWAHAAAMPSGGPK